MWRTVQAKSRKGQCQRWPGARRPAPVQRPISAKPIAAARMAEPRCPDRSAALLQSLEVRLKAGQASGARHPLTRLHLLSGRSRAPALAKVRFSSLIKARQDRQVVRRDRWPRDEGSEQKDVSQ